MILDGETRHESKGEVCSSIKTGNRCFEDENDRGKEAVGYERERGNKKVEELCVMATEIQLQSTSYNNITW